MDAIFSLPYSEYGSILALRKYFKKNDGFYFFVPTSRQQKGIDFLLFNMKNHEVVTFQVKGSRYYPPSEPKKNQKEGYAHTFWFGNFKRSFQERLADFYLLFALYQDHNINKNINSKKSI